MNHPRITVVTHTLRQPQYLAETIRSVLDQGYENLEYIICDGGRDDPSMGVLREYENRLAARISEPGTRIPEAINKAFSRGTGELFCFINSGDQLEQGSLLAAAEAFTAGHRWITGWSQVIEPDGNQWPHIPEAHEAPRDWLTFNPLRWLASFWSARFTADVGGLSEETQTAFDYEFWLRLVFVAKATPHVLRRCMGLYRAPRDSGIKTPDDPYELESSTIQQKFWHYLGVEEQRLVLRRRKQPESQRP